MNQSRAVPDKMGRTYLRRPCVWLMAALALLSLLVSRPVFLPSSLTSCVTSFETRSPEEAPLAEKAVAVNEKIWANITPEQQKEALSVVMPYLTSFANKLKDKELGKVISHTSSCDIIMFGTGYGAHHICNLTKPVLDCNFVSLGINKDYTFDTDLATAWKCRGFAADPTITHPSHLHPLVTFHNIAARMLVDNEQARKDDSSKSWWVTGIPAIVKFLGLQRVQILKMDCEGSLRARFCSSPILEPYVCVLSYHQNLQGCEYSLARDVLVEDPLFFHKVDQFAVETHVSKHWLNSLEAVYYYGYLFKLLEEAGLELQVSRIVGCSPHHETVGCMKEISDLGFPCGWKNRNGHSCHNYLFARL